MSEQSNTPPSETTPPAETTPAAETTPTAETPPTAGDWKAMLPESYREKYESQEQFTQSAIDAIAVKDKALFVPGADASEEDRMAFREDMLSKVDGVIAKPDPNNLTEMFQSLGMPQDAAGYGLENTEQYGEMYDEDSWAWVKEASLAANLTADQYRNFMPVVLAKLKEAAEAQPTKEHVLQELSGEWGAATQAKATQVENFIHEVWPNKDLGSMSAENYKGFAAILEKMGAEPANAASGQHRGGQEVITPTLAKRKLLEIDSNKDHVYWKGDEDARREYVALVQMASSVS